MKTTIKRTKVNKKHAALAAVVSFVLAMSLSFVAVKAHAQEYDYGSYDGGGYDYGSYGGGGYDYGSYGSDYGSYGNDYGSYGNDYGSYNNYDYGSYGNDYGSYNNYDYGSYGNDYGSYNNYDYGSYGDQNYDYGSYANDNGYDYGSYGSSAYDNSNYSSDCCNNYANNTSNYGYTPNCCTNNVPPVQNNCCGTPPPSNCCTNTPPPTPAPVPPLVVSCYANPTSVQTGQNVTWSANVSGGNGAYTYSWTGTDGLSGSSQTVSKSYSNEGTKGATVVVTSNGHTQAANCQTVVQRPPTPQLSLACFVSPNGTIDVGGSVTWSATVSGGDGNYQYSWNGTDGLSSTSQSVTRTYGTSGSKTATVTVTSGNQTQTATCGTIFIRQPQQNNLVVSCYAQNGNGTYPVNTQVTWIASASGGNGGYTYSWNGTDGLYSSGPTATKLYNTSGSKTASVTVYSDGQSQTATCGTVFINDTYIPPANNLVISCYASPASVAVGQNVTWYATASGGNTNGSYYNNYTYSWNGTDALSGYNSSVSKNYYTTGQKYATVTVYANGQSATQTCYANVYGTQNNVVVYTTPGQTPLSSAIYLSQVPYTGSSAWKIGAFFAIVTAWSAAAAWFVYRKKQEGIEAYAGSVDVSPEAGAAEIPAAPIAEEVSESIAGMARSYSILLSEDAIAHVQSVAVAENRSAESVVASVAAKAGANGQWIALSKEKLLGLN